jgi:chromosome segregation ATPase
LKHLEDAQNETQKQVLLSDELQQLLHHVAARLTKEANATLDEKTVLFEQGIQDKDEQIAQLKAQIDALTVLNQEQRDDTDALRQENKSLRAKNDKSQQKLELYHQQISALEQQLSTVQQHNRSLEEKHHDARQALAHYREAMAQQRERENEKHEQECAQLRQASHKTQQALTAKQTALAEAQHHIDTLKSELAVVRSERDASIKSENASKTQCQLQKNTIEELNNAHIVLQAQCSHLKQRCDELETTNSNVKKEVDAIRTEKSRLEGKCQSQQDLIDKLTRSTSTSAPQ